MKRKLLSLAAILLCATLFVSCGKKVLVDETGCLLDYDEAIKYAGKKKLPLLVFFTSEGDDEESTRIVADVMKDIEFKTQILKKYVVLHADFSQSAFAKTTAPQNADAKQQELANRYTEILQNNYQLAMLFNVDKQPAVFLCTKEGYVVSRVGGDSEIAGDEIFQNMNTFKEGLDLYADKLDSFNRRVAATDRGSSFSKVEAIDALYIATEPAYRTFLLPLVRIVPELDQTNETGLCGKFILAAAEAEALNAYANGDVETAVTKYIQTAENDFVRAEQKQECFFTAAYLAAYSGSDDYEGILGYLKTAYELAPESSKAPAINDAITYFENLISSLDKMKEDLADAK